MKIRFRSQRGGFTLVEMLTVIAIIVILAGLVLGGMALAKEKQNRDKAKVQIHLLANALEQYKADNGSYPANDVAAGTSATNIIYTALYWDTDGDGTGADTDTDQKIYLADLNPDGNKQKWIDGSGASAKIIDPWKNEYLYRTGASADNPDFDLWSMGKDGKTDASNPKGKDSLDDIRN